MATELTWLGHSCWSIAFRQHTVVLDPFLEDNPSATAKADEVAADFLLISHGHADHLGDAVRIARRTGALVIANFEICQWLAARGVPQTHAMNIGGGYQFPFGRVKMTMAQHTSTLPDGSSGGNPCGFLLSLPEGHLYFACDTGLFGDMERIGQANIHLAALPIGDNFTMGPDDALEAVRLLRPQLVVPVHYNTWPLVAQDPHAWAARVAAETDAQPVVLQPGGKVTL